MHVNGNPGSNLSGNRQSLWIADALTRGMTAICALPPSTAGARLGRNWAAVPAITNVDGQGTHRRLGNSHRGVASRAASKASLSAVSDNANLIAGALAMRAINT
jgi:hypothetical protein